MSVAWTVGAWGNDTWLGMNAGPPNAWRGATTPASAFLSGSVSPFTTEAQIVAGGRTIILTLANDEWVAAGATFDAQRQNIINGLDSAQSEATGWDAVVKALQGVAGVVRTSDTVVTITLDAEPTYDISANETITATIPASALTTSLVSVVATPTFQVTAFIPSTDAQQDGLGNWYKAPKKKKRKGLRLADFANQEEFAAALARRLAEASQPIERVIETGSVVAAPAEGISASADDDELEDDEAILLAALRITLH